MARNRALTAEACSRAVGLARRSFRAPRLNRLVLWRRELALHKPRALQHRPEALAEQLIDQWPSPEAALDALAATDARTGVAALALAALETGRLPERLPDGWHARLEYHADRPGRGRVAELLVDVDTGACWRRHCVVAIQPAEGGDVTVICAQALLHGDEQHAARREWERQAAAGR